MKILLATALVLVFATPYSAQTGLFVPHNKKEVIRLDPDAPLIFVHHYGSNRTIYEAVSACEHWLFYVFTHRDGTEDLEAATVLRSQEYGFRNDLGVTYFLHANDNSETTRTIDMANGKGAVEVSGYNVTDNNIYNTRIQDIYIMMRFGGYSA